MSSPSSAASSTTSSASRPASRRRHEERLLPGAGLYRARPAARALDQDRGGLQGPRVAHRLLSVGRVPARPASRRQSPEPGHHRDGQEGDERAGPRPRRAAGAGRGAGTGQRGPRTARGVLHGIARDTPDLRDRLRHPLRVRHLRSAHREGMAGREHRQVAALRQPVGNRAAGDRVRRQARRPHRALHRLQRAPSRALDSEPRRARRRLRHPDPRISRRQRESAAAVERAGGGVVRFPRLQRRRLLRRGRAQGRLGEPDQGAVSERRTGRRQAPAPGAAVLLRVVRAAGHDAHPPAGRERFRRLRRALRRTAERHASRDRGGRAHAPVHRRVRHGLGQRVGGHQAHVCVHEPHAAAGGAGEMAGRVVRTGAATPSRDRVRDQPTFPR